ncbi:hypothetical protein KI387_011539 [Taxus chinensis]|uniref:GDSL esterase/lipase n=1 Tax=Taxus chinensis TaxID=29808 RepID=A0AA38CI97_TAXCH|nr:hypothetical protein KI387_011539 [Taxus chinensis]
MASMAFMSEGKRKHEPLVPALFIFGDSLADAGNNNNLTTLAKANYVPYGRDFPGSIPTGRFSNGYNAMDFLSFKLGLPLIPIYADPNTKGENLLKGVNYASGGSGIESYSGGTFGEVTPLKNQVQNFINTKKEIVLTIGEEGANRLLSKAIFYIITANNDWLNTYYFPLSPLPELYTKDEFRDNLIRKLVKQVERLYCNGARNIVVAGLGAVGCIPSQLNRYNSNGSCIGFLNKIARDYNRVLRVKLRELNNQLPNSTILFNNMYIPLNEAFHNPETFGFKYVNKACCGIGKFGGFFICMPEYPVCRKEKDYLFWDAYHPTDRMLKQMVDLLWENGPPYSYPVSGKEAVSRLTQQ